MRYVGWLVLLVAAVVLLPVAMYLRLRGAP